MVFSPWNPLLQENLSNFQTCQPYWKSPNIQGEILYLLLSCETLCLLDIPGGFSFSFLVLHIPAWTKDGEGKCWAQHTESHRTICMVKISSKKLILLYLVKPNLTGTLWFSKLAPLQLLASFPFQPNNSWFCSWDLWFPQSMWKVITHRQCRYLFTETVLDLMVHLFTDLWFAVLLK